MYEVDETINNITTGRSLRASSMIHLFHNHHNIIALCAREPSEQ